MQALLTPKPFRGDVIAAGVVVLLTLVWCLLVRFGEAWSPGVHCAYTGAAFAFVCTLALRSPMEGDKPRAYQSTLYLCSVSLWVAVLLSLNAAVGIHSANGLLRALAGSLALIALVAFGFAARRNSAACTLVGSIAAGAAVLVLYVWLADPDDVQQLRWVLVFETVVFALAAVGNRDRRPRHGVALVNAAGLAVLLIGLSFADWWSSGPLLGEITYNGNDFGGDIANGSDAGQMRVGTGWELLILAAGFGLVAYSSVERQPGPAYLGLLNLIVFTLLSSSGAVDPSLTGWPIVLAAAAVVLLVVGLRPTTPAPPPPDVDAPEPPPLPLR